MSKLVAFIDGSVYSKSVCEHAAWLAKGMELPLEILHVLGRRETSSTPSDLSGSISLGARSSLLKELTELDEQRAQLAQKRGRLILNEAKSALNEAGGQSVATRLRTGDILAAVEEFEALAEMLVVGKRGEAADFARLHLGSNLERIVRSSSKPILVAARAYKPIHRVLVAFDGGASCRKAITYMASNPLFADLSCHLLLVGDDSDGNRRSLEAAQNELEEAGRVVTTERLQGQPEKLIATSVEKEAANLLVMGAYGHSRIRSLIIGSTTSEMIRSCLVPVMLFR
ncbi:universal stress protein [Fodinicurvata fenggangensis]|uniref:universal stress protein n=1 Tax=Fodinicurvata fenggangensis TaxID=1121830 RepID=UPI00047E2462|nr:universal stress protein [Fodinicurvata fenggangensis]